jgi:SAM-dependent methyltransferase
MATPSSQSPDSADAAFLHPDIAQSFGSDADRYDRARPRYPSTLVDTVIEHLAGHSLVDVGIGTGISAEPFRARGCNVLGIEPDPRMADLARAKGFTVETTRFEDWDSAGRRFDGVIAGQTWHWIDPVEGARRAADVLRPGGTLALFWNAATASPEIADEFAHIFESLDTGLPFNPWSAQPDADPYGPIIDQATDGLRATGAFDSTLRFAFTWQATMPRDTYLEQASTSGGINRLPEDQIAALLHGMGEAIDAAGGALTVDYTTVLALTERRSN